MANQCDQIVASASDGILPALRAVDCLANETTSAAFDRLFGGQGILLPALTILLTLYIAFFAISLLTGRSRLGISTLTPRMMTLGLVLTFATSWVAYQNVVWSLATGGPDQLAGIIIGARGSATEVFANRIDLILRVISDVAQTASGTAEGAAQTTAAGSFSPGNLMWLGALLLLLGTVGILVTTRIALAVLLAVGPVFVLFALFPGTRGLFAGWLRAIVLTAMTPLFVIVGGGLMLELLIPVVNSLVDVDGINGRSVLALFLISAVHVALMVMAIRIAATLVSGWTVFGLAQSSHDAQRAGPSTSVPPTYSFSTEMQNTTSSNAAPARPPIIRPMMTETAEQASPPVFAANVARSDMQAIGSSSSMPSALPGRARGIGSRFQPTHIRTKDPLK
jgi:type IV secretion system protein VirB6